MTRALTTRPVVRIARDERGLALLLAAFSVLFVSLLVIAFCQVSTTDLQILDNFLRSTKALYLADAGVEDVISQLRDDRDWAGILEEDLGEGSYKVEDVNEVYEDGQTRIVTFRAMGEVGTFQRIVDVRVIVTSSGKVTILSWDEVE